MPFAAKLLLASIFLAAGTVLVLGWSEFTSKDSQQASAGPGDPGALPTVGNSPTVTRSPTPVPSPTAALAVQPGCTGWPAEVVPVILRLPLPKGLCLRLVTTVQEMPGICAVWVACYDAENLTIWEVIDPSDFLAKTPRFSGLSRSFLLTHELCHAHQHRQIQLSLSGGFRLLQDDMSRWRLTTQGREFAAVEAELPPDYFPLVSHSLENFAHICAAWLLPDASRKQLWIERWPPLQAYLSKWLPSE